MNLRQRLLPLWGLGGIAVLCSGQLQAAELTGRVLDADGQAVVGALVVAYDLRLSATVVETDSSGDFSLSQLLEQPHRLRVIAQEDNLVEQFWQAGGDFCASPPVGQGFDTFAEQVTVVLETGGVLTGRLLNEAGQPVVGATVTAKPLADSIRQERSAVSDLDGVYAVTGLPHAAIDGDVSLLVEVADWPRQYVPGEYEKSDADVFSPSAGEELSQADSTLLTGIAVSGAVSGPDALAESGEVHVFSSGQVVTQAIVDGRFDIQGLPPGEVLVWGSALDLAHTYYPDQDRPGERLSVLEEGQEQENADLFPPYSSTLRGHLNGSGDRSSLWVLAINDTSTVGLGAEVSEDGSFEVPHLHAGQYSLMINAAGTNFLSGVVEAQGDVRFFEVPSQAESEWFEIDLQAGFTLQGTVSEEETGRGLPDLVVVVQHAQEGVFSSVTDDEGGFVVAGIPEGSISVQVDGDPYCEGDPYWSMAQAPLEAAGDVSDQLEWHPTMRRVVPQVPGMDTGTEAQACGCASAAGVPIGWGLWLMALVGFRRAGQRPDRQGRTRG